MSEEPNIFETAAQKLGRSKSTSKSKPKIERSYKDPESQEMLSKIRNMKEDLKNQIDHIKKQVGPAAEHFKKIFENDYTLLPMERDEIELAKKLLEDKLVESMGKPKNEDPTVPLKPSNRKAKTLGSRKKWIPMR